MGRLLERLLSDSQPAPAAIPASPANRLGEAWHGIAESQESQGGVAEMRARLLALAKAEGIDPAHVHRLHDDDAAAYAAVPDFTDDNLRAHLRALVGSARMDDGLIPLEWGEAVARTCEGCGPVLLWATCPDVVKACPWCFRRKAGKAIPRPKG